jgi:hypothetical protein
MAGSLTIAKARKILGQLADGISDEQLEKELEVANLLKTIYFNHNRSRNASKNSENSVHHE